MAGHSRKRSNSWSRLVASHLHLLRLAIFEYSQLCWNLACNRRNPWPRIVAPKWSETTESKHRRPSNALTWTRWNRAWEVLLGLWLYDDQQRWEWLTKPTRQKINPTRERRTDREKPSVANDTGLAPWRSQTEKKYAGCSNLPRGDLLRSSW